MWRNFTYLLLLSKNFRTTLNWSYIVLYVVEYLKFFAILCPFEKVFIETI